jgi:hypothetical protein
MYSLLLRLMFISALIQLGFNITEVTSCSSRKCATRIELASRDILKIYWKPISVWPEEAKRFR